MLKTLDILIGGVTVLLLFSMAVTVLTQALTSILGQRGDQRMLLCAALQLPYPEANEQRQHQQREGAEARDIAPVSGECGHFGSRSISRPSAAL